MDTVQIHSRPNAFYLLYPLVRITSDFLCLYVQTIQLNITITQLIKWFTVITQLTLLASTAWLYGNYKVNYLKEEERTQHFLPLITICSFRLRLNTFDFRYFQKIVKVVVDVGICHLPFHLIRRCDFILLGICWIIFHQTAGTL